MFLENDKHMLYILYMFLVNSNQITFLYFKELRDVQYRLYMFQFKTTKRHMFKNVMNIQLLLSTVYFQRRTYSYSNAVYLETELKVDGSRNSIVKCFQTIYL